MTVAAELRERLARIPTPDVPVAPAIVAALEASIRYLGSDAAERSLARNVYWPKWDSPWWHMLLAFEIGEARRIPERAVRCLVGGLNAQPVKSFPIRPEEVAAAHALSPNAMCHCQLGSGYQILTACGVDVERELPWLSPWFIRYQMRDGGLNCDSDAYLVEGECPSSMVGTVGPLEAMLIGVESAHESGERASFVDRAAAFLIERRLMLGSPTRYNADERSREPRWLQPCFPRFYLYDVLRGLGVLLRWAEVRGRAIPASAIEAVVSLLVNAFPDGVVHVQRQAYAGIGSVVFDDAGGRSRGGARLFPLAEETSRIGDASPYLTRQWSGARQVLLKLLDEKRITA